MGEHSFVAHLSQMQVPTTSPHLLPPRAGEERRGVPAPENNSTGFSKTQPTAQEPSKAPSSSATLSSKRKEKQADSQAEENAGGAAVLGLMGAIPHASIPSSPQAETERPQPKGAVDGVGGPDLGVGLQKPSSRPTALLRAMESTSLGDGPYYPSNPIHQENQPQTIAFSLLSNASASPDLTGKPSPFSYAQTEEALGPTSTSLQTLFLSQTSSGQQNPPQGNNGIGQVGKGPLVAPVPSAVQAVSVDPQLSPKQASGAEQSLPLPYGTPRQQPSVTNGKLEGQGQIWATETAQSTPPAFTEAQGALAPQGIFQGTAAPLKAPSAAEGFPHAQHLRGLESAEQGQNPLEGPTLPASTPSTSTTEQVPQPKAAATPQAQTLQDGMIRQGLLPTQGTSSSPINPVSPAETVTKREGSGGPNPASPLAAEALTPIAVSGPLPSADAPQKPGATPPQVGPDLSLSTSLERTPTRSASNQSGDSQTNGQPSAFSGNLSPAPALSIPTQPPSATPTSFAQSLLDRIHLVHQVTQHLESARSLVGQGEITLQLSPPELGTLRISLSSSAEGISAHLVAESSGVQRALMEESHKLHAALEAQGLKVHTLEISSGSTGQQNLGAFGSSSQPWQNLAHSRHPLVNNAQPSATIGPIELLEPLGLSEQEPLIAYRNASIINFLA